MVNAALLAHRRVTGKSPPSALAGKSTASGAPAFCHKRKVRKDAVKKPLSYKEARSLQLIPKARKPFALFCQDRLKGGKTSLTLLAQEWAGLGIEGQLPFRQKYNIEKELRAQLKQACVMCYFRSSSHLGQRYLQWS